LIFAAKTIYGLLSFPFLVFSLPFIELVLTKSRATAYDHRGHCLPIKSGTNKNIKLIFEDDKEKEDLL